MTTIYFVRHAQSDHSINDEKLRPLTEEGRKDSKKVTEILLDKHIDFLISSPYIRSKDTIADLSEKLGLQIHTDEDFRECNVGGWLGDDFLDYIERQWVGFHYHMEGGECLAEVQNRSINALMRVLKEHNNESIVLATHGIALSTMIQYYYPEYYFSDFFRMLRFLPYVVKMEFDNEYRCVSMEELLIVKKIKLENKPLGIKA